MRADLAAYNCGSAQRCIAMPYSAALASLTFHLCTAGMFTLAATGESTCYTRDDTGTVETYIPCDAPACSLSVNYTTGSAYDRSLRRLLAAVPTNATAGHAGGFFNGTAGSGPDDTAFALAACQADLQPEDCLRCLQSASANLTGYCPHSKKVDAAYVGCTLRYSYQPFSGVVAATDTELLFYEDVVDPDVPGRDQAAFASVRSALFGVLSGAAAASPTRARWGNLTYNSTHMMYGLAQCTRDLDGGDCSRCLVDLATTPNLPAPGARPGPDDVPWKEGASLKAYSCYIRYDLRRFFVSDIALPYPAPGSPLSQPTTTTSKGNWISEAKNTGMVILGVLVIFLSVLMVYMWRKAKAKQYAEKDEDAGSLLFDLPTLRKATGNFAEENKLGHGGFGAVYKGFLPDGREIAVKRLDRASEQGVQQLRNELILVAKLRHNNLAKLLGVCLKGQEKLLVYEYMPNRSLDTFLFQAGRCELLDWGTRHAIIHGTARGLLYLHEDSQIKIIHRDLKASNILLDAGMIPKISDFGLARLFSGDKTTSITSQVAGTLGYMAPEYAVLGQLSVKLDVYSFGVLVLEIVSGRRSTDLLENEEESSTFLSYVWANWSRGTPLEIMDPMLDSHQVPESEVLRCIHVALLCVQANAADRPTMRDVLFMLHGEILCFPAPSKPAFTFSQSETTMSRSGGLDSHRELAISVN